MPFSLKNGLDNTLQVITFIKSSPLSISILNIPCDRIERASSPSAAFQSMSRNSIIQAELAAFLLELVAFSMELAAFSIELAAFFLEHHNY